MPQANQGKNISITHLNIRQSIFFLLLKLIILDTILAMIFLVFFSSTLIPLVSEETKAKTVSFTSIIFVFLIVFKIFITIYIVLQWLNEYYEIWGDKVVHKWGILWKNEEKHLLENIRSVKIHQGAFGRFFNYGTLSLYDWQLRRYATFYLIHNPMKYIQVLEELLPKADKEKELFRGESQKTEE